MIAALLFINQKGEVIIYRTYRDNYSRAVADTFRTQVSCSLCADPVLQTSDGIRLAARLSQRLRPPVRR